MLLRIEAPAIIAEYVGREPAGFHALVELAETLGVPVYDVNSRLNFPSRHPLNLSMVKDIFREADLILCLDTRDWERPTTELVSTTRASHLARVQGLQVDRYRLRRPRDLQLGAWTTSGSRTRICASWRTPLSPSRR